MASIPQASGGAGAGAGTGAGPPGVGSGLTGESLLARFSLSPLYTELCLRGVDTTYKKFITPVLTHGDNVDGVADGHRHPVGLGGLFKTREAPLAQKMRPFDSSEMTRSFSLAGTKRVEGLGPPKPRFVPKVEVAPPAPPPAPLDLEKERRKEKERIRAERKEFFANMPIDGDTLFTFLTEALELALERLKAIKWADWPLSGGNPFTARITKGNAKRNGVPDYFQKIREDKAMDLSRMSEKFRKDSYFDFKAFVDDVRQIIMNAQTYNAPGTQVHGYATELWKKFSESIYPEAMKLYEQRKNEFKMRAWQFTRKASGKRA